MTLLVVPLSPSETPLLTLQEWDALLGRERVLFERPDHPLAERLEDAGVSVHALEGELDAGSDALAVVVDPSSPRVVELAKRGAQVTAGPASPPDALTAAYGATIVRRAASSFADLATVMARLRSRDGCPWDREQDHGSLQVHLLEEAYEVLDAIDRGAVGVELEEELGDVLLQVVFHAQLAADAGRFDGADVASRIVTKLVERHPHVFGETEVADAHEVVRNWEALKGKEKGRAGALDGIPPALPALLLAYKVQKRTARRLEGDDHVVKDRLVRALDGQLSAESIGEALFWVVALARDAGVDPETALRRATARFVDSL